jgi:hypothetical protein
MMLLQLTFCYYKQLEVIGGNKNFFTGNMKILLVVSKHFDITINFMFLQET